MVHDRGGASPHPPVAGPLSWAEVRTPQPAWLPTMLPPRLSPPPPLRAPPPPPALWTSHEGITRPRSLRGACLPRDHQRACRLLPLVTPLGTAAHTGMARQDVVHTEHTFGAGRRIGNSAATPRPDSSRAPSAARLPRRCAPESGGAQWSAAWTCSAGWDRVGPSGVPGKGGCGGRVLALLRFHRRKAQN
jgi:hypothetical protein